MKAAKMPKTPPALMQASLGATPPLLRYPMPSIKKARSRVKKREKKATVERNVQISRRVVKMNQP